MIIPCAGFGTRVGMEPNQSKELLINPENGKPLIEFALDLAYWYGLNPLIITRIEKQDLIQYCQGNAIEYLVISAEGEWADTVLKSNELWDENNILVLPDTVFKPSISAIGDILTGLVNLGENAVFGIHEVDDISKWGHITTRYVVEKPEQIGIYVQHGYAWGIIGFKKQYGTQLFETMREKNKPFELNNCGFVYLREFKDLTRNGKNNLKSR